ncbi:MAG: HDOD domain-containing protein [Desulfobulbaceae bacterium]|nr:HDOD domain-containing protein [Desulfobulbaceae bacterium]
MPSAQELVKKFIDLKTLPHVALRLTKLVNDENSTMHDFEEVIKLDPVLVTRLLRLVNSPYFGLINRVESIPKAVVYVGMKNLRNLVAVEALRNLFKGAETQGGFSRKNLWLHSATVAIVAEMIAKRLFGLEGEDVFLAGILHDIGLVVEDQLAGDLLQKACAAYDPARNTLVACEQEAIGADHCAVGALLAKDWRLPDEVLRAVKFHHDYEKKHPLTSIVSILQLAEYIAGKLQYSPLVGRFDPLPPHLVRHVRSMMANYKVIMRDLPGEMAKAKDLYEPVE